MCESCGHPEGAHQIRGGKYAHCIRCCDNLGTLCAHPYTGWGDGAVR